MKETVRLGDVEGSFRPMILDRASINLLSIKTLGGSHWGILNV